MNTILFAYRDEYCPNCHARLKVYRTNSRHVRSVNGEFIAIHRLKVCPRERRNSGPMSLIK